MKQSIVLYSGTGTQYYNMGKEYYDKFDVFRHTFEEISDLSNLDIYEICYGKNNHLIHEIGYAQMALFTYQIAMTKICEMIGYEPVFGVGYSIGLCSAFDVFKTIPTEKIIEFIKSRISLNKKISSTKWGSIVVFSITYEGLDMFVKKYSQVAIAAIHNLDKYIVTGEINQLRELVKELKRHKYKKIMWTSLNLPAHTYLMEKYQQCINENIIYNNYENYSCKNVISFITGNIVTDYRYEMNNFLTKQIRWDLVENKIYELGVNNVLDIGPSHELSNSLKKYNKKIKGSLKIENIDSLIM